MHRGKDQRQATSLRYKMQRLHLRLSRSNVVVSVEDCATRALIVGNALLHGLFLLEDRARLLHRNTAYLDGELVHN